MQFSLWVTSLLTPFGFTKSDYPFSTFICISLPFVGLAAPCMCLFLTLNGTNFVPRLTNLCSKRTLFFKKGIDVLANCYLIDANATSFKSSAEHSLCMGLLMFPWLVLLQSSGFNCCCSHPNPIARPLKAPVFSLYPILLPCTIPSMVTSFSVSYCNVICSTPGLNCMDDFESPFLSSPYYTLGSSFHPVSIPKIA